MTALSTAVEAPARVSGGPPVLQLTSWQERFGLLCGIATCSEQWDYRLGPDGPLRPRAWKALMNQCRATSVVAGRQPHGAWIYWVSTPQPGLQVLEGYDGYGTDQRDVLLGVTVADCVPVYLAVPTSRTVALLHAGWRGIAAGIVENGVRQLLERTAGFVDDVVIHCGVSICGDCYEVGPEVPAALGIPRKTGSVDLRRVIAERAQRLGVGEVTVSPWCTKHHPGFASHRASGRRAGRMAAFLGVPAP